MGPTVRIVGPIGVVFLPLALSCTSRVYSSSSSGGDHGAADAAADQVAGAIPPAGGPCVTSPGTTTIFPDYAYALAFDDAHLYAATGQGLLQFPLAGGRATPMSGAEVWGLAAANGVAYFSSHDGLSASTTLYRVTLPNGTPQILEDQPYATLLATDGTWLWLWGVPRLTGMNLMDGRTVTFPLQPSAVVTGMAVAESALYLATQTERTDYTHFGSILRAAKDGTSLAAVVDKLADAPSAIALDEDALYWSDGAGIERSNLDGSNVTTLVSTPATSLAVDADAVYYTADAADSAASGHVLGAVQKLSKTGTVPQTIADGLDSPASIGIRGGNVYWVDGTEVAGNDPHPRYAVKTACK
jgi:hypothetical protein